MLGFNSAVLDTSFLKKKRKTGFKLINNTIVGRCLLLARVDSNPSFILVTDSWWHKKLLL